MRIVFLGSPEFALPALEVLQRSDHKVVAVVTQPDRPAGRGHAPAAPPVKIAALAAGLPVFQPENVSAPESVEQLGQLDPDVIIVAAYGQILRQRLLDLPRRGSLNVHASLLPRWRGASPITAAILAGDPMTGVTIMELVRALDAGPMVARVEEAISPLDTTATLEARLATAGARLLLSVLDPWAAREITPEPQDDALATYAPQIKREDAHLDWSLNAVDLWRRVRAFNPWPVAFTRWGNEELKIWEAWPLAGESGQPLGTVLASEPLPAGSGPAGSTFSVQTGEGRLAIIKLQRQGRRVLTGSEFLQGQRGFLRTKLA